MPKMEEKVAKALAEKIRYMRVQDIRKMLLSSKQALVK